METVAEFCKPAMKVVAQNKWPQNGSCHILRNLRIDSILGKKGDKPKVALSEAEIGELIDIQKLNEQMGATVEALHRDLVEKFSLRTTSGTVGPPVNTALPISSVDSVM